MVESLLDQLQRLSGRIAYEQAVLEYGLSGEPGFREHSADILLFSLRIHLYLDLIQQGRKDFRDDLLKDWETILDRLSRIENTGNSEGLAGHALELVLLPAPARRTLLLRQFPFSARIRMGNRRQLPEPVYEAAVYMLRFCMETRRLEEAFAIAENLIYLSAEHSRSRQEDHRRTVLEALTWIVDTNYPLTAALCAGEEHRFHNAADYHASRFYWLYAFSLNAVGKRREALPLFEHCHHLCMQTEGEDSWIGARARQCCIVLRGQLQDAPEDEAWLWQFLRRIDEEYYPQMDDTAEIVGPFTRSFLLKHHLEQQNLKGLLPEILRLLDYCREVENAPPNSALTIRYVENILSAYYLEIGDLILAVDHANRALRSVPPPPVKSVPSDILIYTNLLVAYSQMNDTDQVSYLINLLQDREEEYEDDDYVMSRVTMLTNFAASKLWETDADEEDELRRELYDVCRQIEDGTFQTEDSAVSNITYAQLVLSELSHMLDNYSSTEEELLRYQQVLRYFMENPEIYPFSAAQKMTFHVLDAQIFWQLGSPEALPALERGLAYLDALNEENEARIVVLRFAALIYHNYKRTDRLEQVIREAASSITAAWQKATAYLNDHKICQVLSLIQLNYNFLYAIFRANAEPEALYDQLLRFKDLPALVGRERNRLLGQATIDESLQQQIFALQDQIAASELNAALLGTESIQEMRDRLEQMEAAFFAKFPSGSAFTPISFREMCRHLPLGSAVIEYYFVLGETVLNGSTIEAQDWELDIFVTVNSDGVPRLRHLKIPRGYEIMEKSDAFIDILLHPDDVSRSAEKAAACSFLYHSLIAPALPFLKGITDLYIAPDGTLCNLPFEILCADGSGPLQDTYRICRLVCGRDLLFSSGDAGADNFFILGDPDYEAEIGEQYESLDRSMARDLEPVSPLPFSGIEAQRIGKLCRGSVCTGKSATKYALQEALPRGTIHLATHGVFDEQMESDSLYSSFLVFAGFNKWVANHTESARCGNGVLTADEISRMDLRGTNLVVLSACQSGMGNISYFSTRGLISAFSAAGAKWVVSHMWKANDFTTPILMEAFYDAHLRRGYDVPAALHYAKQRLKTITVGELRAEGWLDPRPDIKLGSKAQSMLAQLRKANDRRRFFADEFYWGGFVCHKCN